MTWNSGRAEAGALFFYTKKCNSFPIHKEPYWKVCVIVLATIITNTQTQQKKKK